MEPSTPILVQPARGYWQRRKFLQFPYKLYAKEPCWVPPLYMDKKKMLSRKKNPWFQHGEAEFFLAFRNKEVVGRIAAIDNHRYNEENNTQVGWFGFFDCIDDVEVARALLDTVEKWHAARGMHQLLGPASYSSNDEWGCIVEGFDTPPIFLSPFNLPYQPAHLEALGFQKAKDLLMWDMDIVKPPPAKVLRLAQKIRERESVAIRPIDMSRLKEEAVKIRDIYNHAWEKNWGFVSMTDEEFDALVADLKLIAIPEMTLFAEIDGASAGFCLTLPDMNQVFKNMKGGRLFPLGILKFLSGRKKINRGRLFIMGVKAEYRRRGLDALLMLDTFLNGRKLGWTGGEVGWTLEDNDAINRLIHLFGSSPVKRYRIFQKDLPRA
ncbi:MAG: N-acetyltransferase [Proteobacteria bacterium]|nr:N-acetyltransferase [Cystobacterineae bacterium]MCL2259505.1 N-acetyltransferase [Cystobacterineae bacterium]MCL2314025.1 N-acetyltransferase [Pseudomonadota bacterium]